jgi:hypothetical protein
MISYKEIQALSQLIYLLDISAEKLSEYSSQKDLENAKKSALDIQKKIKEALEKLKKDGS